MGWKKWTVTVGACDRRLGIHNKPTVPRVSSLTVFPTAVSINGSRVELTSHRPRRLAWPRTSPFHGGNTGSNPVGDANESGTWWHRHKFSHNLPQHSCGTYRSRVHDDGCKLLLCSTLRDFRGLSV